MKAKLILFASIFVVFLTFIVQATQRIVPSRDMTYLGAFKLPDPPAGYNYLKGDPGGDGLAGLEYLPTDGSLIILVNSASHYSNRFPAKYSIPPLVISKNLNDLNTATLVHSPVDIAKGIQQGYAHLGDVHYLQAKGNQTTGKLYWSIYGSYTANSPYYYANGQFGWAETDFDNLNSVGMWRMKDCGYVGPCSYVSGKYLFHTPQAWADNYTGGKSLIQGYLRSGGSTSAGPSMFAFAPWQEGNPPPDAMDNATPTGIEVASPNHALPHVSLLNYDGMGSANMIEDYSIDDRFTSGRWIALGSKQAIIFSGEKCMRYMKNNSWSYPSNYYPGVLWGGDNEGYHDDPCGSVLYFYNIDDITATACGSQSPAPAACSGIATKMLYEPQPYRRVELNPYLIKEAPAWVIGMAYDESNHRLYVEEYIDYLRDVIHVFSLADSGVTALDTTPPAAPVITLTSATKSDVTFSWNPVADDSGKPVNYYIYRNGQPIAMQSGVGYTDSYLSYYTAPVEYWVEAVDFEGNIAKSNVLSIDDSVGGNAPITIFISSFCLPSAHETSCIKFRKNVNNSVPVLVRGGTPPYTWSVIGLPPLLTIDSSTGVISGTPTAAYGPEYGAQIIVHDANGNYARRKTTVGVSSNGTTYYNDRDQDGVDDVAVGGTDTDDLNSEITPGLSYVQPPPTNLVSNGIVSNSVMLSWAGAAKRTDPTWWILHGINIQRQFQNGLDITYEVYQGIQPGVYTESRYVGRATSYNWTSLSSGKHYFAVAAVEFRNLESAKSNEVNASVNCSGGCLVILTSSLPVGTVAQQYSAALSVLGGKPPYNWSVVSGSLPFGLTLNSQSGAITGTPVFSGSFQFSIKVKDSAANFSTKSLGLVIGQAANTQCGKAFGNAWIEKGSDIIETSDGGYLSVGTTASWSNINNNISSNNVVYDMFLVKTNSAGKELWHRVIGQGGFNIQNKQLGVTIHHHATGVVELSDGFLVLGYQTYGNNKVVLIKLDLSGNYVWNRSYYQGYSTREGIVKTNDGNFFLCGYSGSNVVLLKVDSSGNQIWSKSYSNSRWVYPNDCEKTSDGGVIFGGYTLSGSGTNDGDLLLLKVDSSGNKEWNMSYGVSGLDKNDRAWGVTQAYDGGYIIVGRTNSYDPQGGTDYYILKTDAGGNEEWYRISGNPKSYLLADIVKHENEYFVAGYYHPDGQPYTGLLMAFNQSGYVLWSRSINNSEELWTIKNASDGKLLLTGTSLSFTTSYDLFLTAVDSLGNCLLATQCNATGTYYYDKDLDGLGSFRDGSYLSRNMNASGLCIETAGYVRDNSDCNDNNPIVHSCHRADSNLDGHISYSELTAFANRWRASSKDVSMAEFIDAVKLWKLGCP